MKPPQHPHPESAPDTGPGEALQRAIDALPAERTVPADSWTQLQQAMLATSRVRDAEQPSERARTNRRTVGVAMLGMAALLAVVLVTSFSRARRSARVATATVLLPEERRDPRVRAVLDETRNWRAASADSLRSMRWPLKARDAIESALVATETALASARSVLRQHPDDAAARDAIVVLRAKQLHLLQRAMTLLDEI